MTPRQAERLKRFKRLIALDVERAELLKDGQMEAAIVYAASDYIALRTPEATDTYIDGKSFATNYVQQLVGVTRVWGCDAVEPYFVVETTRDGRVEQHTVPLSYVMKGHIERNDEIAAVRTAWLARSVAERRAAYEALKREFEGSNEQTESPVL